MKKSARAAVPRTRRRSVILGALLAAAVLAPALVLAPAAVAGPSSRSVPLGPLPPATGSATLTVQISGAAPADLDLSGVAFELIGSGAEPITALCVTDPTGSCAIEVVPDAQSGTGPTEGAEIVLPVGTYTVRQIAASAGLTPAEEIAPLELCVAPTPEGCVTSRTVLNVSTYRTRTEIQVLSANGPVPGVEVTLTGPRFAAAPVTTDEDGRGAWSGWFLPDEWSFAVTGQPEPLLMTMAPERGDTSLPWRVEITLPSVAQPEVPVPAAGPSAAAPSSGPAQPSTAPAAGNGPAATAGAATAVAVARVVPTPDEPREDVAPAAAPAPTAGPPPVTPGNGQVFVAADGPAVQTRSSAQVLSAGLGILFVAVVLLGYAMLRSRQRRRLRWVR